MAVLILQALGFHLHAYTYTVHLLLLVEVCTQLMRSAHPITPTRNVGIPATSLAYQSTILEQKVSASEDSQERQLRGVPVPVALPHNNVVVGQLPRARGVTGKLVQGEALDLDALVSRGRLENPVEALPCACACACARALCALSA